MHFSVQSPTSGDTWTSSPLLVLAVALTDSWKARAIDQVGELPTEIFEDRSIDRKALETIFEWKLLYGAYHWLSHKLSSEQPDFLYVFQLFKPKSLRAVLAEATSTLHMMSEALGRPPEVSSQNLKQSLESPLSLCEHVMKKWVSFIGRTSGMGTSQRSGPDHRDAILDYLSILRAESQGYLIERKVNHCLIEEYYSALNDLEGSLESTKIHEQILSRLREHHKKESIGHLDLKLQKKLDDKYDQMVTKIQQGLRDKHAQALKASIKFFNACESTLNTSKTSLPWLLACARFKNLHLANKLSRFKGFAKKAVQEILPKSSPKQGKATTRGSKDRSRKRNRDERLVKLDFIRHLPVVWAEGDDVEETMKKAITKFRQIQCGLPEEVVTGLKRAECETPWRVIQAL